jgi:4-aminobutyrate---pyruvate transaminase
MVLETMMTNAARSLDIGLHFHPQTDPRAHEENGPLLITRGEGGAVFDETGNRYIEAMGGLWCASLGFNDRRLAEAAHRQMLKLANYHTFNHRSNEACIDLVEQIAAISPLENGRVFLVNSGSEGNDTMVKLAWFYQVARGRPRKRKIISRTGAFHGSTVMGAALSGLPHMHRSFNLPDVNVLHVEQPHYYRGAFAGESEESYATRLADSLEQRIVHEGADTIAAMIAEPIMGAGGVLVPPRTYFEKIQAVLHRHDILLLADEVICGYGRTGHWFGSQSFDFVPDMMSTAKGLSSGYMPIGAVVVSDAIYQSVADEAHERGVFGHGFTYSGHPVAAAVAAEALRIYRELDVVGRASRLGAHMNEALFANLASHPLVGEIRARGFIAGIELVADRASREAFDPALRVGARVEMRCRAHGVMLRNMGDVLAICPPYVLEPIDIDAIVEGIRAALDDVLAEVGRRDAA